MIRICVGNLSFRATEDELLALFVNFGSVARARIVTDRETGRSRGLGIVEMTDAAQGRAAIDALDGWAYSGRSLTVNEIKPHAPGQAAGGAWGPAALWG